MAQKTVIAGSTVSAQQLKDLFRQIADGGITNLHMQAFLERRNPFGESMATHATFSTTKYFTTRPGLEVSDEFTHKIVRFYPNLINHRGFEGIKSFNLRMASCDSEIIARYEMGGEENVYKHAFTPDQVADLINLRSNGMAGILLNNGHANLFYVVADEALSVVSVYWHAFVLRWEVSAWGLGERCCWNPGDRVFRNTRTF